MSNKKMKKFVKIWSKDRWCARTSAGKSKQASCGKRKWEDSTAIRNIFV